jgi:hypothetical protein
VLEFGKPHDTKHFRWPRACRGHIQNRFYQQVGQLYIRCDFTLTQQVGLLYIHCDLTLTYILLPTVAEGIFGNSGEARYRILFALELTLFNPEATQTYDNRLRINRNISETKINIKNTFICTL